jgi:hypothetical protein
MLTELGVFVNVVAVDERAAEASLTWAVGSVISYDIYCLML